MQYGNVEWQIRADLHQMDTPKVNLLRCLVNSYAETIIRMRVFAKLESEMKRILVASAVVCPLCLVLGWAIPGCNSSKEDAGDDGEKAAFNQQADGSSIGDWASDTWNDALSNGSQTVEGTGKWLSDLYKSAKDQGITKASSMKEWINEDWHAQGDWQYKIIKLQRGDVQSIEKTLNQAGSIRWECYHVDTSGDSWTFFMKRSRRSYLSRVPLRDLANILPSISSDGGE